MKEFILPDIGEGIKEVSITEILISENQQIKENDIIMIVESEKASMEIPMDEDCIIEKILVKVGDSISPGDSILKILSNNKSNEENISTDNMKIDKKDNHLKNKKENINKKLQETIYASPSVRKLARELDCNLSMINGTGKNGRITSDDIHEYIKGNKKNTLNLPSKNIDNIFESSSKWGLVEKVELNNIKQSTGKRLHKAWASIPHVTQFDECDITELDKIRKILLKQNKDPKIKVSFIPFFIKAIIEIFKKLPIFNTSLSEDNKFIIQKKYFNIGIAVNTDRGLVVPVIKEADKKSIRLLSKELTYLIYKAKNKRLTLDDMSGGCFTISSLGGISGKFFTPIINPPEVAILGISNIYIKPVLINNKFKARKVLPISLSYDHRVIDGVDAAKFTKLFSTIIQNPNSLKK